MSVTYLTSSVNNEHAVSHPKTHIFEMIIFEEEKERKRKGKERKGNSNYLLECARATSRFPILPNFGH